MGVIQTRQAIVQGMETALAIRQSTIRRIITRHRQIKQPIIHPKTIKHRQMTQTTKLSKTTLHKVIIALVIRLHRIIRKTIIQLKTKRLVKTQLIIAQVLKIRQVVIVQITPQIAIRRVIIKRFRQIILQMLLTPIKQLLTRPRAIKLLIIQHKVIKPQLILQRTTRLHSLTQHLIQTQLPTLPI